MSAPGCLLCFGFGYTAETLARRLAPQGWRIVGTSRSTEKVGAMKALGVTPLLFDAGGARQGVRAALDDATHILSSVPPDEDGNDPVLAAFGQDMARLGERRPIWLGYLSTTGVYGDRGGGWVTERSPLLPTTERGRRRARAERAWRHLAAAAHHPVHLFRLAGIYGPGRNVLAQLKAGRARRIDKPGQIFSRIHVEDAAAMIEAAMMQDALAGIYNLCDDEPTAPEVPVCFGAALLGIEPPPLVAFADAQLSPMGRSFYEDSKKVSNARTKQILGITLRYPSYREGLQALRQAVEA